MAAVSRSTENLFLRLCFIASRRDSDGQYYDFELITQCSYTSFDECLRVEHLRAFLTWVALPRPQQIEDMLPYLRTLSGFEASQIALDDAKEYCEKLIPDDAPAEAKALFCDIVMGVFMIYLAKRQVR